MHIKQWIIFILVLLILFSTACKKDEDLTSDRKTTAFSAVVASQSWQADSSFSIMDYDVDLITVQGQTEDRVIKMTLKGTGKGNFDLDDEANELIMTNGIKTYHYIQGTGGNVQLTLNDKVAHALSGEFTAMLVDTDLDTIRVDQGVFNYCKYLDTTNTGGGGGGSTSELCPTNMLGASVDGAVMDLVVLNVQNLSGIFILQATQISTLENIQLSFPSTSTAGTLTMDGTSILGVYTKGTSNYLSDNGTITIEEHNVDDKSLKGTYTFTGKDAISGETREISSGSFCVSY